MFLVIVNLPTMISLTGLVLALFGSLYALENQFHLAMVLFMAAGLCDLFDGMVARRIPLTESEKAFGFHLDSIVDMASFGIVPIVIAVGIGIGDYPLDWALFAFFAICAAMRLAYFNVHGLSSPQLSSSTSSPTLSSIGPPKTISDGSIANHCYTGLPVTFSAMIIPLVGLFYYILPIDAFQHLFRCTYFVIALLFVLKFPVPKPKGAAYLILPIVALIVAIAYFRLF